MEGLSPEELYGCVQTLNITEEDVQKHLYSAMDRALITIVMPCILCLCLIGNLGFLFVLWRIIWMKTTLNFYLASLAVADILFLSVSVLEKVARYALSPLFLDRYHFGPAGCVVVQLLKDVCYFASVSLVTLVTLERYYATCRPYTHREHSTRPRVVRLVALVWLCSFVLGCFLVPGNCVYYVICLSWPESGGESLYPDYPGVMALCLSVGDVKWFDEFADALHSVPFVIAMILNVIFFSKIIAALNSMVDRAQRSGFSDRSQHIRDRISRMLVINGILFFILLAPSQITSLTYLFLQSPDQFQFVWLNACRLLTYVNSALNPIVYNATNHRYRKAFRQAFTFRCGRNHIRRYITRRTSSMDMNVRNQKTHNRANSNTQSTTQHVKTTASCI